MPRPSAICLMISLNNNKLNRRIYRRDKIGQKGARPTPGWSLVQWSRDGFSTWGSRWSPREWWRHRLTRLSARPHYTTDLLSTYTRVGGTNETKRGTGGRVIKCLSPSSTVNLLGAKLWAASNVRICKLVMNESVRYPNYRILWWNVTI